ncbi:M48 family metalloprotease, partial [Mycobacterium tuberculosis]|nr:M48 family metalloprotease [Mycobacterium tuberculosis]
SGLIGINVGLLDKAKGLDEIVSVIAHEIAHVSQRHYQHRNDEKTKQLLMQAAGLPAGVAASKVGDGDAAAAVMLGSQAMS